MWNNNQLLRKCGIFLVCVTYFQKQKGSMNIFTKQNYLWTHQCYADFQNHLCSQVNVRTGTEDPFFRRWSAQKTRFILFIYIYYVSQLYHFTFENNSKTFICNVMVVLLYLLCTLDLILNMESTPEMFPPSVFGVWQYMYQYMLNRIRACTQVNTWHLATDPTFSSEPLTTGEFIPLN